MRRIHTAPMEVFSSMSNGMHELEPYEAGWASEATAMVYVREVNGPSPTLTLIPQISADGYRWIDFASSFEPITGPGAYYLNLRHFGNWLRLCGEVSGGPEDAGVAFLADLYWVLKE